MTEPDLVSSVKVQVAAGWTVEQIAGSRGWTVARLRAQLTAAGAPLLLIPQQPTAPEQETL